MAGLFSLDPNDIKDNEDANYVLMNKKKPKPENVAAEVLSKVSAQKITPKEVKKGAPAAIKTVATIKDKAEAGEEITDKDLADLEPEKKDEDDSKQKIFMALAGALPTILGGAFGGAEGAALGAKTTGGIFESIGKKEEEAAKNERERLEKLELARVKAEEDTKLRERGWDEARQNAYIAAGVRKDDLKEKREYERGQKEEKLVVPGYGMANNEDDAKKIKDGIEEKNNFDQKIDEMIALREKHGGGAIMNREDVARGKQLSKDALLSYKNMAKLGVLSAADQAIIDAIIPSDPLAYNSPIAAAQGQDPILNNLKKFKQDSDSNFQTRLGTRLKGYQPKSAAPQMSEEDAQAMQWAQSNPNDPRAAQIMARLGKR